MRIIIALLILSAVILFHELGHFLLAKANHITVLEFSLGLGPRLISFERGGTRYSWKLLPFGGSCAMLGEDEDSNEKGSFNSAPAWRRILVVAAGPVFNFILAFVLALIIIGTAGADQAYVTDIPSGSPAAAAGLQSGDRIVRYEGNGIGNARELYADISIDGIPTDQITLTYRHNGENHKITYQPETTKRYMFGFYYEQEGKLEITQLVHNGAMEEAGLQAGDVITAINGQKVSSAEDMNAIWQEHPLDGSPVTFTYERNGRSYEAEITPRYTEEANLGFSFNLAREKVGVLGTIRYSFNEIGYWIHVTIKSIVGLIRGIFSINDLSGPVGVVSAIGDAYTEAQTYGAREVVLTMLNMMILLTANLGVMNLLPLPALDGGRLVFLIIEAIRRKPVNRNVEGFVHFIGFAALMTLMVFVCYNDIRKLF